MGQGQFEDLVHFLGARDEARRLGRGAPSFRAPLDLGPAVAATLDGAGASGVADASADWALVPAVLAAETL